jgi:hypothetical protein
MSLRRCGARAAKCAGAAQLAQAAADHGQGGASAVRSEEFSPEYMARSPLLATMPRCHCPPTPTLPPAALRSLRRYGGLKSLNNRSRAPEGVSVGPPYALRRVRSARLFCTTSLGGHSPSPHQRTRSAARPKRTRGLSRLPARQHRRTNDHARLTTGRNRQAESSEPLTCFRSRLRDC